MPWLTSSKRRRTEAVVEVFWGLFPEPRWRQPRPKPAATRAVRPIISRRLSRWLMRSLRLVPPKDLASDHLGETLEKIDLRDDPGELLALGHENHLMIAEMGG